VPEDSAPNDPGFIQTTVSGFFFDWNRAATKSPPSRIKWTTAMATKVFLKPPSGSSLRYSAIPHGSSGRVKTPTFVILAR
jgi:hypothetical protein